MNKKSELSEFIGLLPSLMETDGIKTTGNQLEVIDFYETAFEKPQPIQDNILTFIAIVENSALRLNCSQPIGTSNLISLQYSIDNGKTWNDYTFNGPNGQVISLNNIGDSVKFKGNNNTFSTQDYYYRFNMSGKFVAKGDVTSLLNEKGGNAPLSESCFNSLFAKTSLTVAPKLPSLTLSENCYAYMFSRCTSLKNAPVLPATTLAENCYANMFSQCTSLTSAPVLPATTLANNCYNTMFAYCTSLKNIYTNFLTDISSDDSFTSNWVEGVPSGGIFNMNENAEWNNIGPNGVPEGWSIYHVPTLVDLGLDSGTLWADCNIGAKSPEEVGQYFAWGEKIGYYSDSNFEFNSYSYNWSNYSFCKNGNSQELTKYCYDSNYGYHGFTDDVYALQYDDDIASMIYALEIPSIDDFDELINNTTTSWTETNGVYGITFTSNINGNSIFIPVCGQAKDSSISDNDTICLWSKSLSDSTDPSMANYIYANESNGADISETSERCYGLPIRPVQH